MVNQKGLASEAADRIGEYVKQSGGVKLLETLMSDVNLMGNPLAKKGLELMKLFFSYCELYDITPHVSFDLSLARGLDYYTGIIFEAILLGIGPPIFILARYEYLNIISSCSSKWEGDAGMKF